MINKHLSLGGVVILFFLVWGGVSGAWAETIWDELRDTKRDANKVWSLYGDVGLFYNDNVASVPVGGTSNILNPLSISSRGAGCVISEVNGALRYPAQPGAYQGGCGYTYVYIGYENKELSVGLKAANYALAVHQPEAYLTLKWSPWTFSLPYEYRYIYLGGHDLMQRHRLTPALTYGDPNQTSTSLIYRYTRSDYYNEGIEEGYDIYWSMDASAHALGLRQQVVLPYDLGLLYGQYLYEGEDAKGNDFDRAGHLLEGNYNIGNLPGGLALNVRGKFELYNYTNSNSLAGIHREDKVQIFSARLNRKINDLVDVSLRWTRIYNASNIEDYDTLDNIIGIAVKVGL